MTYNVGTHVDLSHLNRKASRATFQHVLETKETEVGTSFVFTSEGRLVRHIPVIVL